MKKKFEAESLPGQERSFPWQGALSSSGLAGERVEHRIAISRSFLDFRVDAPKFGHGDAARMERALAKSGLGKGDVFLRKSSAGMDRSNEWMAPLQEIKKMLNQEAAGLLPANALELSGWVDETLRVPQEARSPASAYEALFDALGWSLRAKTIGPMSAAPRQSLLMRACALGREDIVEMVARRAGLSASDLDNFGNDALSRALMSRSAACARALLANGFVVEEKHWPSVAGLLGTSERHILSGGELLRCVELLNGSGMDWVAFEEKTRAISGAAASHDEPQAHVGAAMAWMEQQALGRGLSPSRARVAQARI